MKASGILLLAALVASFSVSGGWSDWWKNYQWSTLKPENCPYEDPKTHVCSTLQSTNGTCVTIKCCKDFADNDVAYEYDENSFSEEDYDNVHYLGKLSEDSCRLCYTTPHPCIVYRCYRRCCDGYEKDYTGCCTKKTDKLSCENGGTLYYHHGTPYCDCPKGFTGRSCEQPMCYCENGGDCETVNGRPVCVCTKGHYGEHCEKSNCTKKCQNGGECYRDGSYEFCKCPEKFTGRLCEHPYERPDTCPPPVYHDFCMDYCNSNSDCFGNKVCCKEGCSTKCRTPTGCMYNGRHFNVGESYFEDACTHCTCEEGGKMSCSSMSCDWPNCPYGETPVKKPGQCCPTCPGTDYPKCENGGTPHYTSDGETICNCPVGFVGTKCERPLCSCENGGTCETMYGRPMCTCPQGYYGSKCQYRDPNRVVIHNCPRGTIMLNISTFTHKITLNGSTTIWAEDARRNRLPVYFYPAVLEHCRCRHSMREEFSVRAYAQDSRGNKGFCSFKAVVKDVHPPIIYSCPRDIPAFENEVVEWNDPKYTDNIGVAYMRSSAQSGNVFPVGNHSVYIYVWDLDGNMASCQFYVSVISKDTPIESMPAGHRERQTSEESVQLGIILGPVIGGIVILALLLLMLFCCRRRHVMSQSAPPTIPTPAYNSPLYDNVYADIGDVNVKLPPYSELPANPPAYSISGTIKDVNYCSLPPPSYTNPGYESLSVQTPKPAQSVQEPEVDKPAENDSSQ